MPIYLPEKCLRNLDDCQPIAQICADDISSFVCCGLNDGTNRKLKQDKFRVCWKNEEINETSDWDKRDLSDTASVLVQALSVSENMEANESI